MSPKDSHDRKELILDAIIRYFIETAMPVGSKKLEQDFKVSSATIRNDMAFLEKEGLIAQPHTSAGRVPTEVGYRFFVDKIQNIDQERKLAELKFDAIKSEYYKKKATERVYDTVAILSRLTENVAFATIPANNKTFYMGIANILRKPEFIQNIASASEVIEVLEKGFFSVLSDLPIDNNIRIFIGKENIIPQIQTCSMLAVKYCSKGYEGVIGILGSMRMKYAYNKALLELAGNMINDETGV